MITIPAISLSREGSRKSPKRSLEYPMCQNVLGQIDIEIASPLSRESRRQSTLEPRARCLKDLILDIETDNALQSQNDDISFQDDTNPETVRVFYLRNNRKSSSKLPYSDFIKAIENSKKLCDIRATYFCRSRYRKDEERQETIILTPEDSENIRIQCSFAEVELKRTGNILQDAIQLAKAIKEDYWKFKSFVIIDSFDGMEYLSTGLSLVLRNLTKLVIFTGGIDPITHPNSDIAFNLTESLNIASSRLLIRSI